MAIGRFGAANRTYWDGEVDLNLASWDIEGFLGDPARLTREVAADREALGAVQGKSLIHLQCHFGLDTLAWSRLGAVATGVDFSPRAIATAIDLAKRAGANTRFVEADLYETPQVIPERFDVVYTSGGALCWLPDIRAWADVVSRLLKPGGVFYIREAHPMLWSLEDERDDQQLVIGRPYFETPEPKRWDAAPALGPAAGRRAALRLAARPGRDRQFPDRGRPRHPVPEGAQNLPLAGPAVHGPGPGRLVAAAGPTGAPAADVLDPGVEGLRSQRMHERSWRQRTAMTG